LKEQILVLISAQEDFDKKKKKQDTLENELPKTGKIALLKKANETAIA